MSGTQQMAVRSAEKYRFDHKDMDYYFSWILGRQVFAGSDAQECYEAANHMVDGDPMSWQSEWALLARRTEALADKMVLAGDRGAGYAAYLRACSYYRAPLFMMDPASPLFREGWSNMRICFLQAARHHEPPFEPVSVPYRGKVLPGYFYRTEAQGGPRPALIIVGGIETFAEDLFFMVGPAALQRGFNVLGVDLPGQGMNPDHQKLFLEARSDRAVQAVVDYAISHPEIDRERLALFGFSWGGHIALKGAVGETRIKALIANPATHNMFSSALAQQSSNGRSDPVVRLVFQQLAWRFGLSLGNIPARLVRAVDFMLNAKADVRKIDCPTLCMAGESEAKVTLEQTRQTYERLPNPGKRLAILTKDIGGAAHCQIDNLELLNRVIFDWLEEHIHPVP